MTDASEPLATVLATVAAVGDNLRIRVQDGLAVDGHVENDGIGVLGLNVDLALEEGCVGDDILTVHHGVAGTCGVDFVVGVVDQVDHFTRIQLGGILHPGVNACPMDIRSIRHFQHGIGL